MFFDISPWSRLIKYGQSSSIILLVISFLIILSNLDLQITKYLLDIKKIIDEIIDKTRNIKGPFAKLIFINSSLILKYSKFLITSDGKYIAIVSVIDQIIPVTIAIMDSHLVSLKKTK